MKVAMLGWEFPPFLAGGLGVHCLELTTELSRDGLSVDFYMPHMSSIEGPLRVADHHKHIRITEVEADPGLSPYGRGRDYDANFNAAVMQYNEGVIRAFQSGDADLIHMHDWITVPAGVEIARRTGIPLVFTVHSTEFDRSADFFPQPWIVDLERKGVAEADATIGVSGLTVKQLVDRYGAAPNRTFPVWNGVRLDRWTTKRPRDYGRPTKNVLYLSRISRQKGPMFFMDAARLVAERDREAHFIVAGKGEMLPEMIDRAIRWGISDRFSFTGFVPESEILRFYEKSDVYVLPSVSEPFGISVLEAMTTGLPTIVSKTTGVGEGLRHVLKAEYWDTWDMADMLLRLINSKALRSELGRNGALESRRFTWAECGRRTRDVYQWALEYPKPHRRRGRASGSPASPAHLSQQGSLRGDGRV
ncbi:MAG: glycosyltransferase family 4 protein [Thermoplasmatota archaeon]